MKNAERFLVSLAFGLVTSAALLTATGCGTTRCAEGNTAVSSRVLRLEGEARYSTDEGRTWRAPRTSDVLQSGCLVQTAADSHLTIALGERFLLWPVAKAGSEKGALYKPQFGLHNIVILCRGSLVRFDKLLREPAARAEGLEWHAQLELRAGTVMAALRRCPGSSTCDVRFTNGIVNLREGWYSIGARGQVCVVDGRASVSLTGSRESTDVAPGRVFFSEYGRTYPTDGYGIHDRPLILE
jgi:hypothetical protein